MATPNTESGSPKNGDAPQQQEFLQNSREILNQIFKARMAAPHTVSTQETISQLDAMRSKALLANFFATRTSPRPACDPSPGAEVAAADSQNSPHGAHEEIHDETADYIAEEVDNIWGKLRDCAMGQATITADDAAEILLLLSSLVNTDMQRSHEEVAESIFNTIDKEDLKTIDEDFLRYLTSHYAKLQTHDVAHSDEFGSRDVSEDEPQHGAAVNLEDAAVAEKLRYGNDVKKLLTKLRDWDFNVFQLEEMTPYPLVVIAEAVLSDLNLTWKLELNTIKLRRFLVAIQEAYLIRPYHNMLHGTDVTQTMYHLCTYCHVINAFALNDLAVLAIIISAAIHDVGHPGVTGRYLISVNDPLAIQYNDNSPLENMHLATAFRLWLINNNNFTERLPKAQFREVRRLIVEMVLFTDNDRHFVLMEKLESLFSSGDINRIKPSSNSGKKAGGGSGDNSSCATPTDDFKIMRRTASADPGMATSGSPSLLPVKPPKPAGAAADAGGNPPNIGLPPAVESGKGPLKRSVSSMSRPKSMGVKGSTFDSLSNDSTSSAGGGSVTPVTSSNAAAAAAAASPAPNFTSEPRQLLLMQVALHAADVSNPVKPWQLHMRWYPRLMDEFYYQGDLEREAGIPITFAFDRHNPVPLPKFQLGFLKAIVSPMYKQFAKVPGLSIGHCLSSLDANIRNWETLLASDETGERIRTPQDVANETAKWHIPSTAPSAAHSSETPAPPVISRSSSSRGAFPPRPVSATISSSSSSSSSSSTAAATASTASAGATDGATTVKVGFK